MPLVGTATLAERPAPYMLAVELARGKLNDIRNQLSDWSRWVCAPRPSSSRPWPRPSARSSRRSLRPTGPKPASQAAQAVVAVGVAAPAIS